VSFSGRIVIIGAGPCGLGAAYRLRELGYANFAIYEAAAQAGGLASSVRDQLGFVWDYGCHVLYSRSDYFNSIMDRVLDDEWIVQPRDAQVWMKGGFVPYPLQYNLHRLPKDVRRECVLGLAHAATRAQPPSEANFRDWIVNAFGEGIAAHFMLPYNAKVWAHPLERMDLNWIAERVPRPELTRVLANLLDESDDRDWGPNAQFRYPREGGAGAIWRRVADHVGTQHLNFGRAATAIDPTSRRIRFADGHEEHYDSLISTIPINRLIDMARLDDLVPVADDLFSSNVHVAGIGIEGELPKALAERKWIYFPESSVPFYRATVLSNFAPSNCPPGHWSLLTESAQSVHRPIDAATHVDDVIAAFQREKIISPGSRIVSRFQHIAAPGYPTPTLERDRALAKLHPALEALGIYSRGRFGAWRYEIANQDHSFLQGAELVSRLVCGQSESILHS
jgi:protoporphyrinogen oxidase